MIPPRRRRGLTRWELALALLLATAVWRLCEPPVRTFILRTRRAEAGMVLESLQLHLDAGGAAASGAFPRSEAELDGARVPLVGGPPGWTPPAATARCSYRTTGDAGAAVLHAACDVDGDGVAARYEARPGGAITRQTPPEVF